MTVDNPLLSSGSRPRRAGQRPLCRLQDLCAGCDASGSDEYVEID